MIQETPDGVAHPDFQAGASGRETVEERDDAPEAGSSIPRTELEDLAAEAERLVRDGIEEAERSIRRHPLAAVGIAAGVGALLGLLIGRGR